MNFVPPANVLLCTHHSEALTMICLDPTCSSYFEAHCAQCNVFHNHSATLNHSLQLFLQKIGDLAHREQVARLRDSGTTDAQKSSEKNKKTEFQFLRIAKDFKILAEKCHAIYLQMIEVQQELFSSERENVYTKQANKLQDIIQRFFNSTSSCNLKEFCDALAQVKHLVNVQHSNSENSFNFSVQNQEIQQLQKKNCSEKAQLYVEKMESVYEELQTMCTYALNEAQVIPKIRKHSTTDQSQADSGYSKELFPQVKFIKNQFSNSQKLRELQQGTCFQGTNTNWYQLIYSAQSFSKKGCYKLKIRILEEGDLGGLLPVAAQNTHSTQNITNLKNLHESILVGIIKDQPGYEKQSITEHWGFAKSLHLSEEQVAMVAVGGKDVRDIDCMAQWMQPYDIITLELDLEQGTFRVFAESEPKKYYIAKPIKTCIRDYGWRFVLGLKKTRMAVLVMNN